MGSKLEQVRRELVTKAREASKSEEARRLAKEADQIAEILNQDFLEVRRKLREIRAAASSPGSAGADFGDANEAGSEESVWTEGLSEPGKVETTGNGSVSRGGTDSPPPSISKRGYPDKEGLDTLDPAGGSDRKKSRPRGGFKVKYDYLGEANSRSTFDSNTLTILINLDHPVVSAALGKGAVEDAGFRRLSYEIAFAEYSMGLGYNLIENDPDIPADDLLFEVRDTLNRISRQAASLYR